MAARLTVLVFVPIRLTLTGWTYFLCRYESVGSGDFGASPQLARSGHRLQRTGDNLCGASAVCAIGGFRFEQFGVREDDPKLIVQPMEHLAPVRLVLRGGS